MNCQWLTFVATNECCAIDKTRNAGTKNDDGLFYGHRGESNIATLLEWKRNAKSCEFQSQYEDKCMIVIMCVFRGIAQIFARSIFFLNVTRTFFKYSI